MLTTLADWLPGDYTHVRFYKKPAEPDDGPDPWDRLPLEITLTRAEADPWNGDLANLVQAERDLMVAFLAEHHGRAVPFLWEQPFTGEIILVRFGASDLSFETGEADTFSAQVRLEEAQPDDTVILPGGGITDRAQRTPGAR